MFANLHQLISEFWNDESGISSVEYALLLAFVAAGIVAAVDSLSSAISSQITETAGCIDGSGTC